MRAEWSSFLKNDRLNLTPNAHFKLREKSFVDQTWHPLEVWCSHVSLHALLGRPSVVGLLRGCVGEAGRPGHFASLI